MVLFENFDVGNPHKTKFCIRVIFFGEGPLLPKSVENPEPTTTEPLKIFLRQKLLFLNT